MELPSSLQIYVDRIEVWLSNNYFLCKAWISNTTALYSVHDVQQSFMSRPSSKYGSKRNIQYHSPCDH